MVMSHISGFPEYLPAEQIAFNDALQTIRRLFELHGFSPMETAAIEKVETLLSKGTDHEIYGVSRLLDDEAKSKWGLRFDLTVPLARYIACYGGHLNFPYLRYHIAPVWRGERAQSGRYRQFYQCDVDLIGKQAIPHRCDAEMIGLMYEILSVLRVPHFKIHINHRQVLSQWFQALGCDQPQQQTMAIHILDKFDKLSHDQLSSQWKEIGLSQASIQEIVQLLTSSLSGKEKMIWMLDRHPCLTQSIEICQKIWKEMNDMNVPDDVLVFDPSIARGLDYYTGMVFEVKWLAVPEYGSIGGGGRYDQLVQSRQSSLPGVGFSIGLSRLLPKLMEMGIISIHRKTLTQVLIAVKPEDTHRSTLYRIAKTLRDIHIETQIYSEDLTSLSTQLKYASKQNIPYVAWQHNSCDHGSEVITIRRMRDGAQWDRRLCDIIHSKTIDEHSAFS